MFRVYGNDLGSCSFCCRHDDLAGANEGLFICQSYALFFTYGCKRGLKSHGSGYGSHNTVGSIQRCCFNESLHPAADANIGIGKASFQVFCRIFVKYRNKLGL